MSLISIQHHSNLERLFDVILKPGCSLGSTLILEKKVSFRVLMDSFHWKKEALKWRFPPFAFPRIKSYPWLPYSEDISSLSHGFSNLPSIGGIFSFLNLGSFIFPLLGVVCLSLVHLPWTNKARILVHLEFLAPYLHCIFLCLRSKNNFISDCTLLFKYICHH